MAASTAPANTYAARRERLAQQLLGATGQVALRKKSSNLFRDRDRTSKPRLDVRDFNHVLQVDSRAGWADAEGMTPYENLVLATLACGTMPAVVPQLNDFARVPLCGLIAHYNEMQPSPGPDWRLLLIKRATVTGFIVSDHFGQMADFWKEVPAALKAGKIKYREDIVKGIENAPEAFMGLLKGKNFGKLLVQVAEDPTRK